MLQPAITPHTRTQALQSMNKHCRMLKLHLSWHDRTCCWKKISKASREFGRLPKTAQKKEGRSTRPLNSKPTSAEQPESISKRRLHRLNWLLERGLSIIEIAWLKTAYHYQYLAVEKKREKHKDWAASTYPIHIMSYLRRISRPRLTSSDLLGLILRQH